MSLIRLKSSFGGGVVIIFPLEISLEIKECLSLLGAICALVILSICVTCFFIVDLLKRAGMRHDWLTI